MTGSVNITVRNRVIIVLLFIIVFFSCRKDDESGIIQPVAHTVLVYMVADNSLYKYATKNIEDMSAVWNKNYKGKMIVFLDPPEFDNPRLIEIDENYMDINSNVVKHYENLNSLDKVNMRNIISDVIRLFPAQRYTLILWSHATGWLPKGASLSYTKNLQATIELKSFGKDGVEEMDIVDLSDAVPNNVFNTIIFDACFMGGIEVLCEFINKSDYIIASPTEILAQGFPYQKITPLLFSHSDEPELWAETFFEHYNSQEGAYKSATVGVVKTSELNNLLYVLKNFQIDENSINMTDIQCYDRTTNGMFFDFNDYVRQMCTNENDFQQYLEQYNKTVIYSNYTKSFVDVFDINSCSGLNCFIPSNNFHEDLISHYQQTNFYKIVLKK
ncbi:MAG: hypothetical protein LBG15_12665 [Dysgonamonadaceae bacterium]|jgi:hypothetical protein|nr:hypothetical protein [Dysgonamonadaceae bacterium]